MFDKILIANRGEIAIRVMRTCREMGIATVAVYSDFDREARHVLYADEAMHLGGNTPAESYLNTDRIIAAARETGAQAIHPGYGFLAENSGFARAVREAGITWIGPPPEAIDQMGDKVSSRKVAIAAAVDPVPGTTEACMSSDEVIAFGTENGWPVAIKAAYGGGGKGLRVAHSEEEAAEALQGAQREGEAYFGNGECYLERYLERPHHVEVQILADAHGNAVWIGERDCSAQRRHQKLVEETPSPVVDDDLRTRMGDAAVRLAKHVGYQNAGTIECLVQDGEFWFLEMNTRLQVEHCVTEMTAGIDLVSAQIRIAAGEALWFDQDHLDRRGHAIEMRINAEDPVLFLPSPGFITRYREPGGFGVRVDSGYGEGFEVSQFYDNLVAKLIVWGENREEATARALRALGEFEITGIRTNIPAQKLILGHDDFAAGVVTTKWVENHLDLSSLAEIDVPEAESVSGEEPEPRIERTVTVEVGARRYEVKVFVPESQAGQAAAPAVRKKKKRGLRDSAAGADSGSVTTPMQGTVLKILAEVGDQVTAGEAVVVLEAMKMENNINATRDGIVKEIRVAEGDTVGAGEILLVIE
ncbi:MAG: acetyl-CoA carboxylase biotin carboxylase subunit [Actinobacteria bacterium ATB1]|nr:acetyl-CoA carboxylase biotin carboxylase subunit [Actinobacteria bacterium ATB1]